MQPWLRSPFRPSRCLTTHKPRLCSPLPHLGHIHTILSTEFIPVLVGQLGHPSTISHPHIHTPPTTAELATPCYFFKAPLPVPARPSMYSILHDSYLLQWWMKFASANLSLDCYRRMHTLADEDGGVAHDWSISPVPRGRHARDTDRIH